MLNAENVKTMKQTNISADGDQTKQRVKEILKGASKEQKVEMTELSGLKLTSLQRVYATGNISAKIAVAIAQVMNVDPNYLTGKAGEPGEYSIESINAFLTAKGYDLLVQKEQKPRRKYNRKPKGTEEAPKETEVAPIETPEALSEPEAAPAVVSEAVPVMPEEAPALPDDSASTDEMSEEEAVYLLRSLFIQEKFNVDLKDKLRGIKNMLALK